MNRSTVPIIGIAVFVVLSGLAMLAGCPGGDSEVQFDCESHEECLDDEACLGKQCVEAPAKGQNCPDEYEGERYDEIVCEDGQWVQFEQPDAPTVTDVTATPPTVDPGGTIGLEAQVDSEVEDELDYQWTAPDGWELAESTGRSVDLDAHPQWGQTATVDVTVTDPYDQTGSGEVTVSTHEVDGPEINAIQADPESARPGQTQTVEVDAEHPQNLDLDYGWSIPASEGWSTASTLEGPTIDIQPPDQHGAAGNVEVTVSDSQGKEASTSTGVSTVANPGPTIETLDVETSVLAPEGSTTVTVAAGHEFDYDVTDYGWAIDGEDDWTIQQREDDETVADLTAPDTHESAVDVTVTVTDEYGATTEQTVTVHTEPQQNDPPVVDELTVDDNPVDTDGTTQVHVEASDPMGYDLEYSWSTESDEDWAIEATDGDATTADLTAPDVYDSTVQVTVEVTDTYGLSTTDSLEVHTKTETNEPPVVEGLTVDESPIVPTGQTMARIEAYDPFGQDLGYDWSIEGDWTIEATDGDETVADVTAPDSPGETATITVIAEDEDGQTTDETATVETIQNEGPTLESIDAGQLELSPAGTTDLTATVSHPQDFEITSYDWGVTDPKWDLTDDKAQTTPVVAPDETNSTVTVDLTVTDEYEQTDSATIDLSTEANENPEISGLTATPEIAEVGGEVELTVDATDPQGSDLDYNWTISGGDGGDWGLGGSTTETETLFAADNGGSSVDVTVTAYDQYDGESTDTITVESNAGPAVTDLTADAYTIEPENSTNLDATVSHPQGLAITDYTWTSTNDDWTVTGSGETATLESPVDQPNDSTDVTLTVTDEYGRTSSQSVTVETVDHAAPTITGLSTTPDGSLDGSSLPRNSDFSAQVAADADNDLNLSYDWTLPASSGNWTLDEENETSSTTGTSADASEAQATIEVTVTDDWGYESSQTLDVRTMDYEPDDIEFTDFDGTDSGNDKVAPHTRVTTTDSQTLTGFETSLTADCGMDDCLVSTDGDNFQESISGIEPQDEIWLRIPESATYNEFVEVDVTVGETTSAPWRVVTRDWEGTRNFDTCGSTGRQGPTGCDYPDDELVNDDVSVDGGIQTWTVPADGTYRIRAFGASGGVDESELIPSYGARVSGTFELTRGEQLEIAVGQKGDVTVTGRDNSFHRSFAGGGGTFVTTPDNTPILVAGGGGGAHGSLPDEFSDERHGQTSEAGGNGHYDTGNDGGAGDGGAATEAGDTANIGHGGAGFEGSPPDSGDADSYVQGATGGNGWVVGGFGAGGFAAEGDTRNEHGCGGGGGYGGGGGAWAEESPDDIQYCQGGGGGSYVSGDNTETGVRDAYGHGTVEIEFQSP